MLHINRAKFLSLLSSSAVRKFSVQRKGTGLIVTEKKGVKNPWIAQKDPNGSGQLYYWNKDTNETTHLGSTKPIHWVEVDDPQGSGMTYWWDPETNSTTALGASKPAKYRNTALASFNEQSPLANINPYQAPLQPMQVGSAMKTYFALGVGMSFAFTLVGALFG
jgi:hypothetical protein